MVLLVRVLAIILLATGVGSCSAWQSSPPRDTAANEGTTHDTHTSTPPASAARTTLLGNLGTFQRPIKTTSADAQRFFDEGLTLLYGFNHEEAFRSFAHASTLDATSPMPHWGMALALGTNINDIAPEERLSQAYAHLTHANARAANGSDVEQGLVAALGKRYVERPSGDQLTREQAYSDAMGALATRFPDDLDVATLYAESLMNLRPWKLYKADGTPAPSTDTIVSTLERVMAANPLHPGANHYYIHAVEASTRPDRARQAAQRLETLVPGAGHLVHMPAHVYIRTGEYDRSARSNAEAAAVDEKYFEATGTRGMYAVMYYGHNLQFEAAAAMFSGNSAQALRAARRTVALAEPVADEMVMIEPFAHMETLVHVRFEHWDDVLAAPAPAPRRTLQMVLHHHARGVALAATGKVADAEAALRAATDAALGIPAEAVVGPANTARSVAAVAVADLTGRVAEAKGDLNGAVAAFTAAVAAEDELGYNEPPDWLLPERENLGRVLLRLSKASDAERVFRADLVKNVGNPRSLFGLGHSLDAQKKPSADAKAQFEKAWSHADVSLQP